MLLFVQGTLVTFLSQSWALNNVKSHADIDHLKIDTLRYINNFDPNSNPSHAEMTKELIRKIELNFKNYPTIKRENFILFTGNEAYISAVADMGIQTVFFNPGKRADSLQDLSDRLLKPKKIPFFLLVILLNHPLLQHKNPNLPMLLLQEHG